MSTTVTYKGETLTTVSNETVVLETEGTWVEDDFTLTDVTSGGTMQAKSNIDPTTSSQTITPDEGYDGLSSVQINAMPTGTAGTPTASKGAVSNHSIAVTPSVTNSTGYITGGTKTGTAVTVAASELVSGNKAITSNGSNIDVTEYSTVSVNVSGGDMTVTDTTDSAGGTIRSIAGTITSGTATVTNPISKVILNNTTQMDVTTVTATAADVASGKTFLKADGTVGTGTASGGITIDGLASNTEPSGAINITVATIKTAAFRAKTGITSVTATSTKIEDDAFRECRYNTSGSFPNVTTVGNGAFQSNSRMVSLYLPNATNKANYLVNDCGSLTSIDVSSLTEVGDNAFQQCYVLEEVDFPSVTKINQNSFYNARTLKRMILRHNQVVTLFSVNSFVNTPFRGYNGQTGVFYVPSSLISSYKSASNWSTLFNEGYCSFEAIEGSIYE